MGNHVASQQETNFFTNQGFTEDFIMTNRNDLTVMSISSQESPTQAEDDFRIHLENQILNINENQSLSPSPPSFR